MDETEIYSFSWEQSVQGHFKMKLGKRPSSVRDEEPEFMIAEIEWKQLFVNL